MGHPADKGLVMAPTSLFSSQADGLLFTSERSVVDGIERITCKPRDPRYDTPLLFTHGM